MTSPTRVLTALLLLIFVSAYGVPVVTAKGPALLNEDGAADGSRLFAPYIDMSLRASAQLPTIQQQAQLKAVTMAFIVGDGGCGPIWSGRGPIANDTLANGVSFQGLVNGIRAAQGEVIISFGGAVGTELAISCPDVTRLIRAYQSVIDRYGVRMLDFDLEGAATTDMTSIHRRNQALVGLKAANPDLVISYTLPVLPSGLTASGVDILNAVKADGLVLDIVNVMAMNYGPYANNRGQMGLNAILAASTTYGQIVAARLTAKIGVTAMIGVNDVSQEIFQLADAQRLVEFANGNDYIARLSIWSLGRDNGSCAGQNSASPTCSGIAQGAWQFSKVFQSFR